MDPAPRFFFGLRKWQFHMLTGAGNPISGA